VVFFTESFFEIIVDTSALASYYRGSFWIKKLYRSQK